ncbi:multidrug transporter AcrB [Psychromonas sp. psych-6C06]|uniref:efflux RND transporter permease subunit n=1 Tax=Psychromonas sp. psych-6C06 TaxID=2058089 RepID=UPI000C320BA6|nr:efflux RND transporter permease subunit [Psychromonas sp. psych-6C06]PKF62858.1 multidrug transporter AcrB [Psychromonas sp. psych-6C06]
MNKQLNISGRVAASFQNSAITPLLAIVGLLLGFFAIIVTPKEEEPQIDVTFADIFVPFPGASPKEVENLVTTPLEQIISEIDGIDMTYSFSDHDGAMLIVVFKVGVARNDAIVNLYNQIYSNMDKLPQNAGIGQPLIKPRAIDDVPISAVTLWSKDKQVTPQQLTQVAHGLESELKHIAGTRDVFTIGRHLLTLNIRIDPIKMNSFGVSYDAINQVLGSNNMRSNAVSLVQNNQLIKVQTGQFLQNISEVQKLIVSVENGFPVYLQDVAEITLAGDIPHQNVLHGEGDKLYPAVTLAIAKQPGKNAVDVTQAIAKRLAELDNRLIPDNIEVTLARDYGATAKDKSDTLIGKLIFATSAVIVLVLLTMGWREAIVVGVAITITLTITLFASWAYGFTLNRVSLFALIFSIGILVDDAIVVVENIHRHMQLSSKKLLEIIPVAVDEVGGPTILATLTVIAALLPMAFVSGLMGPYMSPIPINASMGMLISLAVAFVLSPWLSAKLLKHHKPSEVVTNTKQNTDFMTRLFNKLVGTFIIGDNARKARWLLFFGVIILIASSVLLPFKQLVVMKMLPFDNKSEFQVTVDLPEGSPVEQTQRLLVDLSTVIATIPEIKDYQLYAGTAAPINFNGLIRHYDLRSSAELGDIQVNLVDKNDRQRSSHEIALSVRKKLQEIAEPYQANVKVVEVPPGPPVWSPLVAEIYGPNQEIREQTALKIEALFHDADDVVDIDKMYPDDQQKWQVNIDRAKASRLGIPYGNIVDAVTTSVGGKDINILHSDNQKYPIAIRLQLKEGDKVNLEQLLTLKLTSLNGQLIALSEVVKIENTQMQKPIMHKNMIPMIMVTADMAGPLDSPLYGMFDIYQRIIESGLDIEQSFIDQPKGTSEVAVLWDGEWKITYETFRDMGIAYAVGMILIYLLVVAQFRSYIVPLVIMAPIPLTVIGVMPGHALLGQQFTATSMIGMIALAGIIVRNSILLVDFINHETTSGKPFKEAVIHSGAVRAKPIILTGLAAMIGAFFILDDPIFGGLAISLIFGILISTVLTLVIIPVLYYSFMHKKFEKE